MKVTKANVTKQIGETLRRLGFHAKKPSWYMADAYTGGYRYEFSGGGLYLGYTSMRQEPLAHHERELRRIEAGLRERFQVEYVDQLPSTGFPALRISELPEPSALDPNVVGYELPLEAIQAEAERQKAEPVADVSRETFESAMDAFEFGRGTTTASHFEHNPSIGPSEREVSIETVAAYLEDLAKSLRSGDVRDVEIEVKEPDSIDRFSIEWTPDSAGPNRPEFCTDAMLSFLDKLRESGVTNMYGAGAYLEEAYPELLEEGRPGAVRSSRRTSEVLRYWMETFGKDRR